MKQIELSENLNHWHYISGYSAWMYHKCMPYLGKRIFDVGAGMGRMAEFYAGNAERVVATDIFQSQVDYMNSHFAGVPYFEAVLLDILESDLTPYVGGFDTVLCVNVLEHLEQDALAIEKMETLLCEGGNLVLFVPAFSNLYCQLDKNVGHYRRYDRGVLKGLATVCDMEVLYNGYFNMLGILPYFIKGKRKMKVGESFSSTLSEGNGKLYNLASKILEPIEERFPPKVGLTEILVMRKPFVKNGERRTGGTGGRTDETDYTDSML